MTSKTNAFTPKGRKMTKTKEKRIEFTKKTKIIIAQRVAYRCSYPGCDKTLIGPGNNNKVTYIGECAHIFSAKKNGPRTDGGLTKDELRLPENGIFLCRNHHKIIDVNSEDDKYTSDLLMQYKNRQEFRISAEIGEYMYPLNWIKCIEIKHNSLFKNALTINLGKVTFFYGTNNSGKSVIIELLYSIFAQKVHPRIKLLNKQFIIKVSLDNPIINEFTVTIEKQKMYYLVHSMEQPFVPYDFFVLHLNEKINYGNKDDDIDVIAKCLNLDKYFTLTLLETCGVQHGLITKDIEILHENKKNRINIKFDDRPSTSFKALSSTEQASVILDFAISLSSEIAKYKSVLLLIDWAPSYDFDHENIKQYLDFLQSSKAHFQTIFVSPIKHPNLGWSGWTFAKFEKKTPDTNIVQDSL